jgi:hypothetical protein
MKEYKQLPAQKEEVEIEEVVVVVEEVVGNARLVVSTLQGVLQERSDSAPIRLLIACDTLATLSVLCNEEWER